MKNSLLTKLGIASLALAVSSTTLVQAQTDPRSDRSRARPFQDQGGQTGLGGWGVRILHCTAHDINDSVNAENIDVNAWMSQIDQLDTITHVMVNLTRGHQASWYSAPWPASASHDLAAQMRHNGQDYFFPQRDLFGELLDAIQARGLKTLVYFSMPTFDQSYMGDGATANINAGITYTGAWVKWAQFRNQNYYDSSSGVGALEAGASGVIKAYADEYGDRIDGWWIDRCYGTTEIESEALATAARSGNPDALVTMHTTNATGLVKQNTIHSDYTGGHPTPMNTQPPWTRASETTNLTGDDMVARIVAGPWVDSNQNPVVSNQDVATGALGHIFMPFQAYWRNKGSNPDDFPDATLELWTEAVINAGGLYTWAVERDGSGFQQDRFNQLVTLNAAVKAEFPNLGPNTGTGGGTGVSHWNFNESTGNTAVDVASDFDATISGATRVSGGASGNALDFDGVDDVVTIPAAAFDDVEASDEVSIAAWVDAANGPVLRASDSSGRVLNAFFNANGNLYWDAGNNGTSSYDRIFKAVSPSVHTGGWSHWVFTKNASTGSMKIYLNGNLWHSGSGKIRTIDSITGGYIGATSSVGANSIDGLLDEVKLYDRELTASEVVDLYNTQGDLGVLFQAIGYDAESHPGNDNVITIAGVKVGKITNGSWIHFNDFNFGTGASNIVINAGGNGPGGTIQVRKGSSTGTLLGSVSVTNTGDWNVFQPFSTTLNGATGIDDLYFVFVGGGGYLMTVESFEVSN